MAQPIPFHPTRPEAPEHAEAIESALELLQLLHDRGILNLLRGAVGAGDELVDKLATAANTPESIRAMRNLIVVAKLLGNMSLPETLSSGAQKKPETPGIFDLLRKLRKKETRRGLGITLDLLESVGKAL